MSTFGGPRQVEVVVQIEGQRRVFLEEPDGWTEVRKDAGVVRRRAVDSQELLDALSALTEETVRRSWMQFHAGPTRP